VDSHVLGLKIVQAHVCPVDLVSVWTLGTVAVIVTRHNLRICGAIMIIVLFVTETRTVAGQTVLDRAKRRSSVQTIALSAIILGALVHVLLFVRITLTVSIPQMAAHFVPMGLARDPQAVPHPVRLTKTAAPTRTAVPNASATCASAADATPSATTPPTATARATAPSAWAVSSPGATACARPCVGARARRTRSVTGR